MGYPMMWVSGVIGFLLGAVVMMVGLLIYVNEKRTGTPDPQWQEQLAHNKRCEDRLDRQVVALNEIANAVGIWVGGGKK